MKTEKRRTRGLFAALVSDPYRKLVAIGLAIGLWFLINSQIQGSVEMTATLNWAGAGAPSEPWKGNRLVVLLPTDRVVGLRFMDGDKPQDHVKVLLSGPRYRIDALSSDNLDLQITSFTGLDWSTRRDVEFTASDIRRDLQGVTIELEPSRIRLEVERLDKWPIKLGFDYVELVEPQDSQFGERLRRDLAEFSPPEATILGTASAIQKIRGPGLKPLRARVTGASSSRQVSARIELAAPKELDLRLAEIPSVTIPVLPDTTPFDVELPLVIDDLALPPEQRGIYEPEVRTKLVRILAGGDLRSKLVALGEGGETARRQNWAKNNLRLLVHVPAPEPGLSYGPEFVREARLLLLGPLQATVDRTECFLEEPVSVTLRKRT